MSNELTAEVQKEKITALWKQKYNAERACHKAVQEYSDYLHSIGVDDPYAMIIYHPTETSQDTI